MRSLIDTAVEAARAAGEIQKAHVGRTLHVDQATRHDLKLEVDRLCERAVLDILRRDRPGDEIWSEEAGRLEAPPAPEYRWIVDPLDGTVNYFHGLPYYCSAIACFRPPTAPDRADAAAATIEHVLGRPVFGVIHAPPTDELFVGEIGRGATLNGRPIRPADATDPADVILSTGFGARDGSAEAFTRRLAPMAERVRKLRCFGSACYDLCNVACGRLGAYCHVPLRAWDIAAGLAVVAAAGGHFEAALIADDSWDVLACAPGLREPLRALSPALASTLAPPASPPPPV